MQKCCYCFGLDIGCILIGVINIVSSSLLCAGVIVFATVETMNYESYGNSAMEPLWVNKRACKTILVAVGLLTALVIITSTMLIYGIKKNKAAFVMVYFVFGVLVTIVSVTTILLELLQMYWAIAMAQFLLTSSFVYTLFVTYSVYEMMMKGLKFGTNAHQLLDNGISTIN